MQQYEITGTPRAETGKGVSRRLRRNGRVPAVIYGAGKGSMALELGQEEMLRHLDHEGFYSHVLTLKLGDGSEKVVLKDLQRHPYRRQLLHVDLLRIDEHEKITMRIPVHFINEDKCIGVKQGGGIISHLMTEIETICLPKDLPEFIEVDLAEVGVGTTLHIGDLTLPVGVESAILAHGGDPNQPVVSVHLPRVEAPPAAGPEAAPGATPGETPTSP
ncbi:MAG: 50S ribosomal protein L25/general stress protein Ctc [Gammaproteobacteria bacterium]